MKVLPLCDIDRSEHIGILSSGYVQAMSSGGKGRGLPRPLFGST